MNATFYICSVSSTTSAQGKSLTYSLSKEDPLNLAEGAYAMAVHSFVIQDPTPTQLSTFVYGAKANMTVSIVS